MNAFTSSKVNGVRGAAELSSPPVLLTSSGADEVGSGSLDVAGGCVVVGVDVVGAVVVEVFDDVGAEVVGVDVDDVVFDVVDDDGAAEVVEVEVPAVS